MPPPPSTTLRAAAAPPKRPASSPTAGVADSNSYNTNLSPPDGARKKPPAPTAAAGIITTTTTAAGKRTACITTTAAAVANTPLVGARHPLRLRDQNGTSALRAVKPGPELKSFPLMASRMPSYERPTLAGHRQPTAARAVNKPPLTPKIAARSQQPSRQQSQLAPTLATPLARRPPSESTLSVNGTGSRDRDGGPTSPVSSFLNSNITPRSGSRQSRVDSANSTPNGTPNPDRHVHDQWETRSGFGVPDDVSRRPVLTFRPPSEVGSVAQSDKDSKFFYASDAQKQPPQPTALRSPLMQQQKPATFFYASGETVSDRQAPVPRPFSPPPLTSPSAQDSLMSKFIYANGVPELQPAPKIGSSSGSVVSTASRLPPSKQSNGARAASPVKPAPPAGTKNINAPSAISPRSPVSTAVPQTSNQAIQAKTSGELPSWQARSHTRTKSAAVIEQSAAAPKLKPAHSSVPSSGTTSPSNPAQPGSTLSPNPAAAAGFASLLQAAEDFAETEEAKSESPNSPTTKLPQEGQPISLVANARRERKVQDLEITNASLEAINRTLERQLRKQTAELRRYQRLSRSGRLSMGSLASMGSRVTSDSTVEGGGLARAGMSLDDLSEEESEIAAEDAELEDLEEDSDPDSVDDNLSVVSGELSPGANALRYQKQRRDEHRLQLDLSKHRQLLVDSQKINQSLKRCLGWTEELIKEGKRALAYQVRPSDVALGGRVLAPEELERRQRGDDAAEVSTLGEETIYAIDALGRGSLGEDDAVSTSTWSEKPQDRDSGIELAADGGEDEGLKA
ncbi:hypothetical protein VTI74DRAFT_2711 [Chaetomium olivicolor]